MHCEFPGPDAGPIQEARTSAKVCPGNRVQRKADTPPYHFKQHQRRKENHSGLCKGDMEGEREPKVCPPI